MQRSNTDSISKSPFPDYRLSLIAEDLLATLAARLTNGEPNATLLSCLTDTRRPNRLKFHADFLAWIKSALPRELPDLDRFDDLIDDLLRYSKIMANYFPACSAIDLARRELVILNDYIHHPPEKLTLREHCRRIDKMDARQISAYEAIHAWCVAHPLTGKDFLKGLATVVKQELGQTKKEILNAYRHPELTVTGCHHEKAEKDKIVQRLIRNLSVPGVTFSIHAACVAIFGKDHRKTNSWLYDWCRRHKREIENEVDYRKRERA